MRRRTWQNGILGGTPLDANHLNAFEDDLGAALLALAADPSMLFAGMVTRDSNGAPTSAAIRWPDGTGGTYAGTASTVFPSTIDSYTVTYAGSSASVTITQPTITRDASGRIINRPALTIT